MGMVTGFPTVVHTRDHPRLFILRNQSRPDLPLGMQPPVPGQSLDQVITWDCS